MKTSPDYSTCRYWGYEPASRMLQHADASLEERAERRNRIASDAAKIKAAGFRPYRSGIRTKTAALKAAKFVENVSGVEMHVYNHDYL